MQLVPGSERIVADGADPVAGRVRWSPAKSIWIGSMTAAALLLGPATATPGALLLFTGTLAVTLCAGHSVGLHRRLIHESFGCPRRVERVLVYLGVLVGMQGPFGMMRQHDLRDWAQRQPDCHDFLAHRAPWWRDGWEQLHCELLLDRPPRFSPGARVAADPFHRWLQRTWMAQQLPWALLFFALGGLPWVVWGVCARVAAGVTGHWLVGWFAHNRGPQGWIVEGACVQGHDVPVAGLVSMGEAWHNNHHAYPGSARLGPEPGQADLGWALIRLLQRAGLAWDPVLPEHLPHRSALRRVPDARPSPLPAEA